MLPTTIAGSLPKPSWLAEPEKLWAAWRLSGDELRQAQRDATLVVLHEQEHAGIDIVSNGEQFRQHFVHGFLTGIDGVDFSKRQRMGIRDNRFEADCPTVVAPISRPVCVHGDEVAFTRANTRRQLKFTMPGPMTVVDTLADDYYGDRTVMAI